MRSKRRLMKGQLKALQQINTDQLVSFGVAVSMLSLENAELKRQIGSVIRAKEAKDAHDETAAVGGTVIKFAVTSGNSHRQPNHLW